MKEAKVGGKDMKLGFPLALDKVKTLVTRKDQVFCFLLGALGGHTFLVSPTPKVCVPLSGFLLYHTYFTVSLLSSSKLNLNFD